MYLFTWKNQIYQDAKRRGMDVKFDFDNSKNIWFSDFEIKSRYRYISKCTLILFRGPLFAWFELQIPIWE